MPVVISGSTGITTPTYNGTNTAEYLVPVTQFKNRIINGGMVIDQRNAGASVTPTSGQYTLDRWQALLSQSSKFSVLQNSGSITAPDGFNNYLGVLSSSAYSLTSTDYFTIGQPIEGFNVADLNWGTANAKTVTLSFWVWSSLTGTFGGVIQNQITASGRYYPFTYSIPVGSTWTKINVTIPGDTSGTWNTTNGIGIYVNFGLGVGTTYSGPAGAWSGTYYLGATGATSVVSSNAARWNITGVQLEVGSTATSFDYRNYGTELALCQRYFECNQATPANGNLATFMMGAFTAGGLYVQGIRYQVKKRTSPSTTFYYADTTTGTGWGYYTTGWNNGTNTTISKVTVDGFSAYVDAALVAGSGYIVSGGWAASAEL